jgi:hypothetical protein
LRCRDPVDAKALKKFLCRSQDRLAQMQALMLGQAALIDARSLRRMTQWSREIAAGAELASLTTLARAADQVDWLASDVLNHPHSATIGFSARMDERLCALETQIARAIPAR